MKWYLILAILLSIPLCSSLVRAEDQPTPPALPAPAEQSLLQMDFDQEHPDAPPASAARIRSPEGSEIRIADASTKPADPFGGDGNRSLMLSSGEALQLASFNVKPPTTPVSQGKLTLDFYTYVNSAAGFGQLGPFLKAVIGADADGNKALGDGEVACWIDLRESGRVMIRSADGLAYADQTYPANQVNKLEITFDLSKESWSVFINGQPVTTGKGTTRSFKFKDHVTAIGMVNLYNQGQNGQPSRVFTDNLKVVIPSP